jgi:hypothetical protein
MKSIEEARMAEINFCNSRNQKKSYLPKRYEIAEYESLVKKGIDNVLDKIFNARKDTKNEVVQAFKKLKSLNKIQVSTALESAEPIFKSTEESAELISGNLKAISSCVEIISSYIEKELPEAIKKALIKNTKKRLPNLIKEESLELMYDSEKNKRNN